MPTTKTSKTHGTEVILFISHQGSVQLGYVDTFPMHGTVLLQYKFPHAQQSSLSGCACGAATIKHTASCHFISAPTYIESNLSQKHLQNVPPCSPPPHALASPQPAQAYTVIPQTEPGSLFPDRHFLLLCHWPQTLQGINQVLTFPVLYFAMWLGQDP